MCTWSALFTQACLSELTLLTPSFGKCPFAYHLVLNHPLAYMILSYFFIPKFVKIAAKIWNIGQQNKNLTPKNNLDSGFFCSENVSKGSHYLPGKIKQLIFHFQCLNPTPNMKECLEVLNAQKTSLDKLEF